MAQNEFLTTILNNKEPVVGGGGAVQLLEELQPDRYSKLYNGIGLLRHIDVLKWPSQSQELRLSILSHVCRDVAKSPKDSKMQT